MTTRIAVFTIVLAGLLWIDPLFVPLVLLGPIATGVVADRRKVVGQAAFAWCVASLITLVIDWAVNGEDQVFHLVMAVWTSGLTVLVAAVHSRANAFRNRIPGVHRQTTGS